MYKKPFIFAIIAFILLQLCNACINFKVGRLTRNETQMKRYLHRKKAPVPSFHYYSSDGHSLRYMRVGDSSRPLLLFLHGSPGSMNDFDAFFSDSTLNATFCLMAVDRPGYGFSNFGKADTGIIHQARLIVDGLKQIIGKREYSVFGYSFGGPVAAAIAAMDTGSVQKAILLSATLAPGEERIFNISYTIEKKGWNRMFPAIVKLPNAEKLSHANALKELGPWLKSISCPVLLIHGDNDKLVYYSNTNYGKSKLIHAATEVATIHGGGHAILWSDFAVIKTHLLRFLALQHKTSTTP